MSAVTSGDIRIYQELESLHGIGEGTDTATMSSPLESSLPEYMTAAARWVVCASVREDNRGVGVT